MTPTNPTPPPASSGRGGNGDHHAHDRHHAQQGHADHDGLYNEDVAHEDTDVNIRTLVIFCLGLVAVVAVASFAMGGLFRLFEDRAGQNDPPISPSCPPLGRMNKNA